MTDARDETTKLTRCTIVRQPTALRRRRQSRDGCRLTRAVEEAGIDWRIEAVHCMGQCHAGPTMRILPNGPYVMGVQEADVPDVIGKLADDDLEGLAATYPMPGRDTND